MPENKTSPRDVLLDSLDWRLIGPFRGGRVIAVAGHPIDDQVFYFGSTGGGVWKTTDGGQYWKNVSDGYFKRASVGALAVSHSDPNVVYAGMGESTIRGNVSHGDGVYRSTDGGKTWSHLGLAETRNISKVRVHPGNPDVVYVAALGHAHGENPERGVYRSTDGGKTWDLVLHKSNRAGAIDLAMDPNNPRVLYASIWEAKRTPYSLISGGEDSGIYKSTDGGDTWEEISHSSGLPKGILGKVGLAVSPAQSDRVWAIVEAEDGAVFRSDDGGSTWKRLSEDRNLRQRAWYYHHIYADPQDPETVYVLNVEMWKSTDAGKTFGKMATPHPDNHDLWIDPKNPQRMVQGNDGGACVSFNGGASWSSIYNQATSEFYHVTTDNDFPYRVYGAQQDNSTITTVSRSNYSAISNAETFDIGGGESGYIAVRPDDSNIIYAGSYGGLLTRYDRRTARSKPINVWPETTIGEAAKDMKYRFQWTFPIVISPHDPNTLFVTGNVVFKSTDEGQSWEPISEDLTRAEPHTLEASGGPITKDNTGAETYATVFAFAESPVKQGVYWAGTDDGRVHVHRPGIRRKNWDEVTPPDLPEWALINIIEASPHDAGTAYMAATRYKSDDFAPYLYKTTNYGKTWTKITNGIPDDDFTRVIREDPKRKGLLYAGTETGLYVSYNDGASWQRVGGNLPVVPIHDLVVKDDELVLGTHGRSFWILDDLTPLRTVSDVRDSADVHLFRPRDTVRFRTSRGFGLHSGEGKNFYRVGPGIATYERVKNEDGEEKDIVLDAGQNPPDGVAITYYLREKPDADITLSILDAKGNEVRSFKSKKEDEEPQEPQQGELREPNIPKKSGMNRFVWDMRYPPASDLPGDASMGMMRGGMMGPLAVPGKYQVRLEAGGKTLTEPFEIVPDPRVDVSQKDLQAQFDLLMQIRDKLSETHDAIKRSRRVRAQVDTWTERLKGQNGSVEVVEAGDRLKEKIGEIEGRLTQVKAKSLQDILNFPIMLNGKLVGLIGQVGAGDGAPSSQSHEVFNDLSGRVDKELKALDKVLKKEAAAFNKAVSKQRIEPVSVE
jgi:photosystem II stability/assembly factor-like uncharacterized protein